MNHHQFNIFLNASNEPIVLASGLVEVSHADALKACAPTEYERLYQCWREMQAESSTPIGLKLIKGGLDNATIQPRRQMA